MSLKVLLVNPNTSEGTTRAMAATARAEFPVVGESAIDLHALTVAKGPTMLVDEHSLLRAADETVSAVVRRLASDPGIDGVIVAAFGDPGVDELRSRSAVPVVGIGESAIRQAARSGPFSIATTTPLLEGSIRARVERLGAEPELVSIVITPGDPLALAADPEHQTAALGCAVARCVADGARSVVIGGGPLADSADDLSRNYGVAIINPVRAACRQLVLHHPSLPTAAD